MSAATLRVNTTAISRNSPNSCGSSDSDEMPALIFACDSDSDSETMPALIDYDSDFESMPALVDDDGEIVCDAIERRTAPQELTGYTFSDFFAGALNVEDVYADTANTPDTTFIVYDGKTRGFKSLGGTYLLDAYHQKTNAQHRLTNA